MKTLQAVFARKGFSHKLVVREPGSDLAIYERKHSSASNPHYEVIRIRVMPQRTLETHTYPEQEVYPAAEDWGKRGWTYATLAEAQAKLASLKLVQSQSNC